MLEAAAAVIVYALAIVAYGTWGAVLAIVHRARRETALATTMTMLAISLFGIMYGMGYGVVRGIPKTPALVLASPAAAASTLLAEVTRRSMWRRFDPAEAFLYGVSYSALLLAGALWYFSRQRAASDERTPAADEALAIAGEEQQYS
jgi:hypothetical protein